MREALGRWMGYGEATCAAAIGEVLARRQQICEEGTGWMKYIQGEALHVWM